MIQLPADVLATAQTLKTAGFQAYLVGGALRDHLLHQSTHDYDLATNATPAQIKPLFSHTILIGEAFGIIGVHTGKQVIHIGTFRKESGYADARHPENIQFTQEITEDLARRDFTMNAMAYEPFKAALVDPYNGHNDLNQQIIRGVGDPEARMKEDTLRIFRAFRFMSQLGFTLEAQLKKAISNCEASPLPSAERITEELTKLVMGPFAAKALEAITQTAFLLGNFSWPNWPNIDRYSGLQRWAFVLQHVPAELWQEQLRFSRKDRKEILSFLTNF